MTATHYKIGGSVVTLRSGGLSHEELEVLSTGKGLSVDGSGCRGMPHMVGFVLGRR